MSELWEVRFEHCGHVIGLQESIIGTDLEPEECPLCRAVAQSAESGSRSKQPSPETEPQPSLLELVSRLIVVQTEALAQQVETNLLLRQTITHTTLLIDAMAEGGDPDFVDESRYLDGTPRN